MQITKIYTYLGENGTITSPVLLNLYHTTKYQIMADKGKKLTKENKTFVKIIEIPQAELDSWIEVEDE